jgi:hypothetical protein
MTVVLRFVAGLRYEIAERDVLETIASLAAFRRAFWQRGGAAVAFRVRTTDRGELQVWGAPLTSAWVLGTSELVDGLDLEGERVRTGDEVDQRAVVPQHGEADEAGRGLLQLGAHLSCDGIKVSGCGQRVANGRTARGVVDEDGHGDLPSVGARVLDTPDAAGPTVGAPTDTSADPSAVGVSVDPGVLTARLWDDIFAVTTAERLSLPALARALVVLGWTKPTDS